MLVEEEQADGGEADPVREAEMKPRAGDAEEDDGGEVREPGAVEDPAVAEADGDGVEALLAVDPLVEERVEEVEARYPEGDRGPERPRRPRQSAGDRDPCSDRREPVNRAEPEVGEPRE